MALPKPPVTLKDHCSVVHDETLYTFQPDAFQSLPLKSGGQWSQLPMGVSTKGARCVLGSANGQDALFIVGGTTNSSYQDYKGLQCFSFKDRKWESPMPQLSVVQNRLLHGAAYLQSTASILIYSGFQDNSYMASSQTFTISTNDSTMRSYNSNAPPVQQPLVLPWNSSHAVMIGGDAANKEVWTFSEADGWHQVNVTLPFAVADTSKIQGTVVTGTDGSKMLELFDLSKSPNTVSTFLLQPPQGSPAPNRALLRRNASPPTKHSSHESHRRRRDLTFASWPPYNSSLAPTTTRQGFSLAQDLSGLVVVSGGGPTDSDSVAIFNQTGNTWIDGKQFFGTITNNPSSPSGTTGPSPGSSATPSASPSSTSAPTDPNAAKNHTMTILGAVLGTVFGLIAVLILALLILRCLRQRKSRQHQRRFPLDPKDQMDFSDQGAEFMPEAGGSVGDRHLQRLSPTPALTSADHQGKRGLVHKAGDSNGSAKSFFSRKDKTSPVISSPQPRTLTSPPVRPSRDFPLVADPRTEPRTDEGWSTYFMNNHTGADLTRLPPGYTRYQTQSRPTTYTSQSDYTSDSRITSSHPHESAEVPPLNIRASQYPPSEGRYHGAHAQSTQNGITILRDPASANGTFAHVPEEPDSLHDESSGQDSWTPIATSDRGSERDQRPASSVYADGTIYPHPGNRVRIPDFPGVPSSNRTSLTTVIPVGDQRGLRSIASRDFAGGVSRPERQASEAQTGRPAPRAAGDAYGGYRGQRVDEDMSWLNLGPR